MAKSITLDQGTKVTIISGSCRGRKGILQANVFDKSVDWPELASGFLVQLLNDQGEEDRSVVVRCHQVKVGWN